MNYWTDFNKITFIFLIWQFSKHMTLFRGEFQTIFPPQIIFFLNSPKTLVRFLMYFRWIFVGICKTIYFLNRLEVLNTKIFVSNFFDYWKAAILDFKMAANGIKLLAYMSILKWPHQLFLLPAYAFVTNNIVTNNICIFTIYTMTVTLVNIQDGRQWNNIFSQMFF